MALPAFRPNLPVETCRAWDRQSSPCSNGADVTTPAATAIHHRGAPAPARLENVADEIDGWLLEA